MQTIKDKEFGGERPLFGVHDVHLDNVTIREGESAIKKCSNIIATGCRFEGNYPFWHVHGFTIRDCYFAVGGRSALWYSDHLQMSGTVIDAPKMFREMNDIDIENVVMNDADEVFWRCTRINARNLMELQGTGVDGVAVVSALFGAGDIEAAARHLRALSEKMTEE